MPEQNAPQNSLPSDFATVLGAGTQLGAPKRAGDGPDHIPYAIVPEGCALQAIARLERPHRKTGAVIVRDLESLIAYCARHQPDAATLYMDAANDKSIMRIIAVLNEHEDALPGFRDHRAVWPLAYSRQWMAWTARSGKAMSQTEFAEFLEEHLGDIEQPDGAEILEIALNFSVTQKAHFLSQQILRSGQTVLTYQEELQEGGGANKLSLPNQMLLRLPIFQDGVTAGILARLRYRLQERKLTLSYQLANPAEIVEARLRDLAGQLRAQWPGTLVMGAPE